MPPIPSRRVSPRGSFRADSLVGMAGHEIGHIPFYGFSNAGFICLLLKGWTYVSRRTLGLTTKEQIYLSELKQVYDDDEVAVMALMKAALYVNNILEDVYIKHV